MILDKQITTEAKKQRDVWLKVDKTVTQLSEDSIRRGMSIEKARVIAGIEKIKEDVELAGSFDNPEDEGYYKAVMNILDMLKEDDETPKTENKTEK